MSIRIFPQKPKHAIGKKRYRVPRGEGLGVAWHNSSSVWIAFACSVSCPMTGRIRNQTLVHFVSDNRKAFHIASQSFDLCFNLSLQCIRTALISMVSWSPIMDSRKSPRKSYSLFLWRKSLVRKRQKCRASTGYIKDTVMTTSLLSKSTQPRKFGNHVTVHRPTARRPSAPQENQCLLSHF